MFKVELVLNVEKILPDCLRDNWIIKTETHYPNQRNNFFKYYFSYQPVKKSIAEKVRKTHLQDRIFYKLIIFTFV